jgi:hypothetical protein
LAVVLNIAVEVSYSETGSNLTTDGADLTDKAANGK